MRQAVCSAMDEERRRQRPCIGKRFVAPEQFDSFVVPVHLPHRPGPDVRIADQIPPVRCHVGLGRDDLCIEFPRPTIGAFRFFGTVRLHEQIPQILEGVIGQRDSIPQRSRPAGGALFQQLNGPQRGCLGLSHPSAIPEGAATTGKGAKPGGAG
jgi:hypothetical protein